MTDDKEPFAFSPSFYRAEDTGSFLPKDFERQYQELYAQALEAGEISESQRVHLDLIAHALGIPEERIAVLEEALRLAAEQRASITLTDAGEAAISDPARLTDEGPRASLVVPSGDLGHEAVAPTIPPDDAFPLPSFAAEGDDDFGPPTEPDLEAAGALESSDVLEAAEPAADESPATAATLERTDEVPVPTPAPASPPPPLTGHDDEQPTPFLIPAAMLDIALAHVRSAEDDLHERFTRMGRAGVIDAQYTTAAVLVQRGAATAPERELFFSYRATTLQRPERPLTSAAWTALLFHPHEDRVTGDIFAMVAPAALLARVSALSHDRSLIDLDRRRRQDPASTTVSAARALGWAAATLGLRVPPIYVAPELDTGLEVIPSIPPASRIGARMLTGPSAIELAFQCARHLTWFREEHFICTLVSAMEHLEDIFLAALLIGAPELPLYPDVRIRASLNRDAILPTLGPGKVRRLRDLTRAFLTAGGRTSIGRWVNAAELTACRAGLLLCGDLAVACDVLSREAGGVDKIGELESFWASDAATELRRELGVAIA